MESEQPLLDDNSYGQRLLPTLVDEIASEDPDRAIVSLPVGRNPSDGYEDVNFASLARAINRCSWWLEKNLGKSSSFKTLFYIGPQDLRLVILAFAAIKTGHKLFLGMPILSLNTQLTLLEALDCHTLLTPEERLPIASEILSKRQMQTLTVPSLRSILEPGDIPIYPFTKIFSEARNEPFVCLHTSGSTGLPKPIVMKHGTMTHHDLFLRLSAMGGKVLNLSVTSGTRMLFGLLLCHSAGRREFLAPNVLNDLVLNPTYLQNIKQLRYLTFGGAALPRNVGNKLKSLMHLFVSFGATETGFYALETTEPEDWEYVRFSPFMGCELRTFANNLHELYFVRNRALQNLQGVFSTFPNISEYSPKDLYSKHPSKHGLWLYEGRSDDMIVASHGMNFNPLMMEGALLAHPLINGVLVCGQNRNHASLLIEARRPPQTEQERSQLLLEIWPSIELANEDAPQHGKIARGLVLFTELHRPMIRAGKGTVLRKMTVGLYENDLEEMYNNYRRANEP